jgi:hypothetical protein
VALFSFAICIANQWRRRRRPRSGPGNKLQNKSSVKHQQTTSVPWLKLGKAPWLIWPELNKFEVRILMGQTLSFCQLDDRLWLRYALSQLHSKGELCQGATRVGRGMWR